MKNNIKFIKDKFYIYINIIKNFFSVELNNLLYVSFIINILQVIIIYRLDFYDNYIKYSLIYLINIFTLDNIYSFILINRYILFVIFLLWIGICFDSRFKFSRKILLPFYFIFFFIFLILVDKKYFFLEEIFWYTLIINFNFVFHVLILDWLYLLAIKFNNEYAKFIITRISFIFSLSFVVYLVHIFYLYYMRLDLSKYKKFYHIERIFILFVFYILLALTYFIDLFASYSLLLMGRNNFKLNLDLLIRSLLFIIVTFMISYFILGILRIYFLWIYLVFNYFYNSLSLCKFSFSTYYRRATSIVSGDFSIRIGNIYDNYNSVNSKNFSYGFIEFLDYTEIFNTPYLNFHIKCPFVFYSRNYLIISYIRSYFTREFIYFCFNEIDQDTYDFVFMQLEQLFNVKGEEALYYKNRVKKIYKKHLKINDI